MPPAPDHHRPAGPRGHPRTRGPGTDRTRDPGAARTRGPVTDRTRGPGVGHTRGPEAGRSRGCDYRTHGPAGAARTGLEGAVRIGPGAGSSHPRAAGMAAQAGETGTEMARGRAAGTAGAWGRGIRDSWVAGDRANAGPGQGTVGGRTGVDGDTAGDGRTRHRVSEDRSLDKGMSRQGATYLLGRISAVALRLLVAAAASAAAVVIVCRHHAFDSKAYLVGLGNFWVLGQDRSWHAG